MNLPPLAAKAQPDFLTYHQPFARLKLNNGNGGGSPPAKDDSGSRLIRYSTTSPLGEEFQKGLKKPYIIRHHKFHPHGFHLFGPSEIGLEPLPALRMLQSRLKDQAIKSQLTGREIKAEICQSAVVLLEQAEKDVEQLEKKRSDALIFGEEQMAKELAKHIREKFDRALFSTYADLLLDSEEVKAFGIESQWTGPSEGKQNENDGEGQKPAQRGSSHSDWEGNLEEERREARRRRRERRRGKRAKSAILGKMMREKYDISDLEAPELRAEKKEEEEGKKMKKQIVEKKKDGADEDDEDEEDEESSEGHGRTSSSQATTRDEAVGTLAEGGPSGIHFDTQSLAPIDHRRSLSVPPPNNKHEDHPGPANIRGILKGPVQFSLISDRLRRKSSTVPPSVAREVGRTGTIVEDAVQRMQRLQRRVQSIGPDGIGEEERVREAANRFRARRERGTEEREEAAVEEDDQPRPPISDRRKSSTVPPPMARERGRTGEIVENAVQRMQRLQRGIGPVRNDEDGVREAAKRFREQRRREKEEAKRKEDEEEEEEERKEGRHEVQQPEEEELQLRRRVNFAIDQMARQPVGKIQWRRNSRANLHRGEPEWRRPNQGIPVEIDDEEKLFPDLVKTSANICPYCEQRDPWLENEDFLRLHFADRCPFLSRCEYCDKIVEVHELNEHQLKRCPFVGDTLVDCYLCGMARYPDEPEAHPKCRFAYPPADGAWCPLCSALIRNGDSKEEWLRHLTDECYNNPRTRRWNQPQLEMMDRPTQMLAKLNEMFREMFRFPTSLQSLASSSGSLPFRTNRAIHQSWRNSTLGLPSILPSSTSASGRAGLASIPQIRPLDVHHLRAAVRRLNHERRVKAIQRNVRISRRDQAIDSDSD